MAIRVPSNELAPEPAHADETLALEECAVVRWRGYTRSTFVACLADGTPVAESQAFKARGDGAPAQDGPAGEAHAQLLRELEALGWTRTGDGDSWFDVRYGHWIAAPQAVEPEVVEEPEASDPPPTTPVALPPPLPVHVVREPAPAPAPAAESPMPPADETPPVREVAPVELPPAAPTRRRPRRIAIVSVLGIVAALALGAFIAKTGSAKPTRTVQLVSLAPKSASKTARLAAAPKPTRVPAKHTASKPKPAVPQPMRLVIVNIGHGSWLEVRSGSTQGPVLYSGIVPAGTTLRYAGARLWVRFAAAANFRITVDGRPIALTGTVDELFRR
jgi:hypothetical protein